MTRDGDEGDGGKFIHAEGAGLIGSHTLCGFTDLPGVVNVKISSIKNITCNACISVIEKSAEYLSSK